MSEKNLFFLLGLVGVVLFAAGGAIYAITREFGVLPLSFVWAGLLSILLFFYVNFSHVRTFTGQRSTKHGINMAVMVVVFMAIIGMISVMSVRYKTRIDLTGDSRYSLSAQTIKILKSLEKEVEVIAFYRSDERSRQAMHDLLKEFSYHTPKFNFWFVDPDRRPIETAKYGVTSYRTTLIRYGDKQETVGFESEEKITNALLKVTSTDVKTIYFLKGHGEKDLTDEEKVGYKLAREAIEGENYKVSDLLLINETAVPDDTTVLVVAGPKKDILPGELKKIEEYVNGGGSVLFLLDPLMAPDISAHLKGFGFTVGNDIIIDKKSKMMGANYLTPVVMEYNQKHMIGKDFEFVTFFPVSRSVEIEEDPATGRYNLAKTGSSSWAKSKGTLEEEEVEFNAELDQPGPINLAAVSVIKVESSEDAETVEQYSSLKEGMNRWGRIITIGDSDFAGNAYLNMMGNKDFFLNTISWLAQETALVSVRKKSSELSPLTLSDTQSNLVFWLCVIIGPTLILAVGVGVTERLRRNT